MRKEDINKLIEKYNQGLTTPEEEKELLHHLDQDSPFYQWLKILEKRKKNVPQNLNEKLWDTFDKNTQTTRKLPLQMISVAASIVLLVGVVLLNKQEKSLSYQEKKALLDEARSLLVEEDKNEKEILYDDDLIVIYTE